MGRLSTHILDTASGVPAAGMRIDFYRGTGASAKLLRTLSTNADGRTDEPLLEGADLTAGVYQIVFHVAAYFRDKGHHDAGLFLEDVPVAFIVRDPGGKTHVPLLVSPWSYTTYRGS